MTPGTQPQHVSRNTIATEPHPLSNTASGGKTTAKNTRRQDTVPPPYGSTATSGTSSSSRERPPWVPFISWPFPGTAEG